MKITIALIVLLLSMTAQAATFTVTKTADTADGKCDTDCSLREAIIAANAKIDNDTIVIPAGVYLIQLFDPDDTAQSGDYDVLHDVSIIGAGMSNTVIDGAGKIRVFDVLNGARVSINNMTVTNGYSDIGAGIYVSEGASLSLSSVNLLGNTATLSAGGIYIKDTTHDISISDSIIQKNKALGTIDDVSAGGGAGAIESGNVSIKKSIVSENTAVRYGGAFAVSGLNTKLDVDGSSFLDNSASDGGAINIFSGALLVITNSTLIGNQTTLDSGGALEINGTAKVSTSTIVNNTSKKVGGGILLQSKGTLDLTSTTITGNTASVGGGLYVGNGGVGTIRNTIIASNTASNSEPNVLGDVTSNGYNLLGSDIKIELQPSDIQVADAAAAGLGALIKSEKAGESYIPLLEASPAINKGSCAGPNQWTDQLGTLWQGACDIGSVETYCGDKIIHPANGEQCEDGNKDDQDTCLNTCKSAKCGDGVVQAGVEVCDDGNAIDDDACPNSCKSPTCGDAIVQKGNNETCDDGNADDSDSCLKSCVAAKCGDGIVQKDVEACDDGNVNDGDGCSAVCKVEIPVDIANVPAGGGDKEKPVGGDQNADNGAAGGNLPLPAAPASGGGGCSLIR